MHPRTVVWSGQDEGRRARKRRELRQALTDAATVMFLRRGFDAVRVSDVAAACGVSEKTVFNHFRTKESLILDRWESTTDSLRRALADPGIPVVTAAVRVLDAELAALLSWLAQRPDPAQAALDVRRFGELVHTTPALRAYQRDVADQLVAAAAEALAGRAGLEPGDPRVHVAAIALVGLWEVQGRSLRTRLDGVRTPDQVRRAVTADVRSAAGAIGSGLASIREFGGESTRGESTRGGGVRGTNGQT
jgi:AcrR family transcriptional regulator